jgi:purine-binding chemotaxis protein CheW
METVRESMTTQYLTFTLDEELFAVEIGKVREVLDFTAITKVPQTPHYMRGVINLRGSVVPVVDMRLKLGLPPTETTVKSCIIIVEVEIDKDRVILGALADAVQEVLELAPDQIEATPRIGTKLNIDFIRGMGRRNEQFIIMLDVDKVFSEESLAELTEGAVGTAVDAEPSGAIDDSNF